VHENAGTQESGTNSDDGGGVAGECKRGAQGGRRVLKVLTIDGEESTHG